MARTNRYTCKLCAETFERCVKCMVGKPDFDAEHFCTKEHNEVYSILSKHGCNLITADEALAELKAYNIDEMRISESVVDHIEHIKSEATVKTEVAAAKAESETSVVKTVQQSKKNKKKW